MRLKSEKVKYLNTEDIHSLPETTGVYLFKKGKDFLYIGKAINIKERVKNHFQQPVFKDNIFIPETEKIGYIATGSEIEALILEAELIKRYQPKYNTVWRDGKNYFFVAIAKETFPRVLITHQLPLLRQGYGGQATTNYSLLTSIGPFVDGKALKQTLRILRKVFPYRTCRAMPKKACLYKELELCPAPCELKMKNEKIKTTKQNLKITKQYKKSIKNLTLILLGKKTKVVKNLKKEMLELSKNQEFEKAAKLRDQLASLENILAHSRILEGEMQGVELLAERKELNSLQNLQKLLGIKTQIQRIEGYDISNIQGLRATGSMVVFKNGQPNKNEYRKFHIHIEGKPNDTAMLGEMLTRRLKHAEWKLPQVMLIDGGKGQLNTGINIKCQMSKSPPTPRLRRASKTQMSKIKIIAIAKRNNELYIEDKTKPILLKNLPQEITNLILRIRDEAHRFAIAYHKKLRKKSFFD